MQKLITLVFLLGLILTSGANAASYQMTDGTIVDPIQSVLGGDLDYAGANLEPNADLTNANLTDAFLGYADLAGANLSNADLTGADLRYVSSGGITGVPLALKGNWTLVGGYLIGPSANLTGADLAGADLAGANLNRAYLSSANLTDANLADADLTEANLTDANLTDADLSYANLRYADLNDANLSGANLTGADLSEANLSNADLNDANLSGARLWSLNLTGANLTGADLSLADLRYADLRGANLYQTTYLGVTYGLPYYNAETDFTDAWDTYVGGSLFDPVAADWILVPEPSGTLLGLAALSCVGLLARRRAH